MNITPEPTANWTHISLKDLTVFMVKLVVAMIPGFLVLYIMWAITMLTFVFTTQVLL